MSHSFGCVMSVLDDLEACARLDEGGMLAAVRDLPGQCRAAWKKARSLSLPEDYRDVDRIVVLGMGGSAIAGGLLRCLVGSDGRVQVESHRGYSVPKNVGRRTLLIASSYSGDTEETIAAFLEGLCTEGKPLVVAGGGRLLALAEERAIPTFSFEHRSQSRAALGYSLMPLLAIADRLGILPGSGGDVDEALSSMEVMGQEIGIRVPSKQNGAKRLAEQLPGRLPVMYGGGFLTEVARRWKTQINENAKAWAFHEELPEASHNAIQGYGLAHEISARTFVVLLRSARLQPRLLFRYQLVKTVLDQAGIGNQVIEGIGDSILAQMLTLVLFGDYVSCYLALLTGVDPSPVPTIEGLKNRLASQSA